MPILPHPHSVSVRKENLALKRWVDSIFEKHDLDGNGNLSSKEFIGAISDLHGDTIDESTLK